MRFPSGGARVTVDFENFCYNNTDDDVPTRCFDDPITIRDDATGHDFARIDGYCPPRSRPSVSYAAINASCIDT